MGRLDGKVAVITGATSGIGLRSAEIFVTEGAKVVIAGRRAPEGEALAKKLGPACVFRQTDVTIEEEIRALIGEAVDKLIERFVDWQFTRRDENKFLEVTLRSGRKEILYRSDLISGAIIASIVERAKATAIKRAIATNQEEGIREMDLQLAFDAEYIENDIFPTTDITEDWLKLIDYDPENVVKIAPVKPIREADSRASSGII